MTPRLENLFVDREMSNEVRKSIYRGCGYVLHDIDGPTHNYMLSSPACFAAYTEVLAFEYSDPLLMRTHRLTIDAFAIQHPGDAISRQAIPSVGLDLARLAMQLHHLRMPKKANDIMLILGKHRAELKALSPPTAFSMTVAEVLQFAGTPTHAVAGKMLAVSAWEEWSEYHEYILDWADKRLWGPAA